VRDPVRAFLPSLTAAGAAFVLVLAAGIVTLTALTWLAVPDLRFRMLHTHDDEPDELVILDGAAH
jgi:hypothetical protein